MNKIIQALSNRGGPFNDTNLGVDPNFVAHLESVPEQQLRQKLFLNVTDTDYYLKSYRCLIHAYPDMERHFEDKSVSFLPETIFPRGVAVSGADLISSSNLSGVFKDTASEVLPIPLVYTITYHSPFLVEVKVLGSNKSAVAGCAASGDDPNKMLNIDWPTFCPFQGLLRLKQEWTEDARIVLEVTPSRFPYQPLVDRCSGDLHLSQLLINYSLVDAFHATVDPAESLAIALTVLGLSNTSVYPPA